MRQIVSNQISPNFSFFDGMHAAIQIFRRKNCDFSKILGTDQFILINAARTGLSLLIDVLQLPKEKKIGIPAFICAVVATPFLTKGYTIEWIDTDDNGVIDPKDFEQKSEQLGLVIVPHIFGQKAPRKTMYEISKKKGIFVIEDGAHFFDTSLQYCDAKILSFGREKIYSCVSGGVILWKDKWLGEKMKHLTLPMPPLRWTLQHALQPFFFALALPIWKFGGKVFVWVLGKLRILPRAVTKKEKQGMEDFPQYTMPSALQHILMRQFQSKEKRESHRQKIAQKWKQVLHKLFPKSEIIIPLNGFRVILKTENAPEILKKAKKNRISLT
jgi:dTDP-4-amino-4,6-dideoxygalactose transaminase